MNPCTIVVFGGTGDLMKRKIVPALGELMCEGSMPRGSVIVGVGRRPLTSAQYKASIMESDSPCWKGMKVGYFQADLNKSIKGLSEAISSIEGGEHSRIFYCATGYDLFGPIVRGLNDEGLNKGSRIVFEKPHGNSLKTAKELDKEILDSFDEKQVYRIDHYLGKDAVQNLLVLRFANPLFERVWNKDAIESIRITIDEELGVGERIGYYDAAGALRDMLQNHMLQLASFVLMEAPKSLATEDLHAAKAAALKSLVVNGADDVVLAQYADYSAEVAKAGIARTTTETFAALRLYSKDPRWKKVPIILRSGKKLPKRYAQIEIRFRKDPCILHCTIGTPPNILQINIQPTQDINFAMATRAPSGNVVPVTMGFAHSNAFGTTSQESYKRLLAAILVEDDALFTRPEEIEAAWKLIDRVQELRGKVKMTTYKAGTDVSLPW